MKKAKVRWKSANELTIAELLSMAEDGYEFVIQDGEITEVQVPMMAA